MLMMGSFSAKKICDKMLSRRKLSPFYWVQFKLDDQKTQKQGEKWAEIKLSDNYLQKRAEESSNQAGFQRPE